MRVKGHQAFRRHARSARRAAISEVVTFPVVLSFQRRPRSAAANSIAAAVAGILYGSSGTAYAQEQPTATRTGESLQEVVVTASAQSVKKLDASYNVIAASPEMIKEANPKSASEVAKSKDRFLAPPRRGVPLATKNRDGLSYRVQSRALAPDRFFASKVAKGQVTVTINKTHPFFEVYSGNGGGPNPDVKFVVDSLLLAMARAEQSAKGSDQRDALRRCLLAWSDNLAAFLRR